MVTLCWLIIITVGGRKRRRFIVVVESLIIDLVLVIILVKIQIIFFSLKNVSKFTLFTIYSIVKIPLNF